MQSLQREAIRSAIDAAVRARVKTSGTPHRRPEEMPVERDGTWMPVRHQARKPLSPFYCLTAYEGEVC